MQRHTAVQGLAHRRQGARMVVAKRQGSSARQAVHEQLPTAVENIETVRLLERQRNATRVGASIRLARSLPLQHWLSLETAGGLLAKMRQAEQRELNIFHG
ncbi:hypothetical protein D3C79_824350 [compost metagenome]